MLGTVVPMPMVVEGGAGSARGCEPDVAGKEFVAASGGAPRFVVLLDRLLFAVIGAESVAVMLLGSPGGLSLATAPGTVVGEREEEPECLLLVARFLTACKAAFPAAPTAAAPANAGIAVFETPP